MSNPSHPLVDLVIPNGTTPSNTVVLKAYRTARALSILGPATVAEVVVVQGQGVDDVWRSVQVSEADLNVTAGDTTLVDYPGRFKAVRLNADGNVAAERTFECQVISELD